METMKETFEKVTRTDYFWKGYNDYSQNTRASSHDLSRLTRFEREEYLEGYFAAQSIDNE
jgi:hypothetical protein